MDKKGMIEISGEWSGSPFLQMTKASSNSRYYSVCWGDGTLTHYDYFRTALDVVAMDAEISEIFQNGASKKKGEFGRGSVHGYVGYVTKEAAEKISEVVERHFRDALNLMVEAGVTTASIGEGYEPRNKRFKAAMEKRNGYNTR